VNLNDRTKQKMQENQKESMMPNRNEQHHFYNTNFSLLQQQTNDKNMPKLKPLPENQ